MNTYGKNFRFSIFGESHGDCIGCTIDGLPAGFAPDFDFVSRELSRRSPGAYIGSTSRRERDEYKVISGMYNGRTTGMPLTVIFPNNDVDSSPYINNIARPGHADFAAYRKYHGYNDPRGGGAFSGRLTAALVFAGAIAKQLLSKSGIEVISHVASIGHISDSKFDPVMKEIPDLDPAFPLVDNSLRSEFDAMLTSVREAGDSIGGTVEAAAVNIPIGVGEPYFRGFESCLASILYSIPGVHGVEFGAGFAFSVMRGSEANDQYLYGGSTSTNNSGGINGGISNGMPVIFRVAFRPVPTVFTEQSMLDLETSEPILAAAKGRHDACILPRGCVIVECAAAICIYDLLLQTKLN